MSEPNSFLELINECYKDQKAILINGMGVGKITKLQRNHLEFEVIKKREEKTDTGKNSKEKKLFKETTMIPLNKINTISEGEKAIAKPKEDEAIAKELDEVFK